MAKLLLKFPEEYVVRAITRDPTSETARALQAKGALIVKADLTAPSSLTPAVEGCWGVFGVTNFYDGMDEMLFLYLLFSGLQPGC